MLILKGKLKPNFENTTELTIKNIPFWEIYDGWSGMLDIIAQGDGDWIVSIICLLKHIFGHASDCFPMASKYLKNFGWMT